MIAVTGATGNVGSILVRTLTEAGAQVIAISRGERPADLPAGATHRRADIGNPDDFATAVTGADTLFLLITGPQLTTGPEPHLLLKSLAAQGIRRVVFLSSQGAVTRPGSAGYARTLEFEQALTASTLEWTIVRPSGFASNTYAWIEPVRAGRPITAPFADVGLPVVDPADIAAVAATALREPGHHAHAYTLTGPALVTPRDQAQALSAALGHPIPFAEVSRAEAFTNMLRFMPAPVADHTLDILGSPLPAELEISPDIEAVLGRPPRSYGEWALHNAAVFSPATASADRV
ncbi:NAD(P)H-binding protein [Nocardia sp. alder85J]|uniref:NAD(P)H-binding protein n=1 Tax=Nocardia sp. alder85J TaxID=2862949 RepID=UPI001CD22424|nr:NAD(P)H-binding protein [Nocardia sp. alder85J]MCX4091491.1 NAD(P)H-binding protein [Nocardia sp. alder85J]